MHVWPFFRQLSCKKLLNIVDSPACCILFTFPPGLHTANTLHWAGDGLGPRVVRAVARVVSSRPRIQRLSQTQSLHSAAPQPRQGHDRHHQDRHPRWALPLRRGQYLEIF